MTWCAMEPASIHQTRFGWFLPPYRYVHLFNFLSTVVILGASRKTEAKDVPLGNLGDGAGKA